MSEYQYQDHLGTFAKSHTPTPTLPSSHEPPIPENQEDLELLTPMEVLNELRDRTSATRQWVEWISNQYQPPQDVDCCLLYPCASEKPIVDSKTYHALSKTLEQFSDLQRERIHVITVSEPYSLIPLEFQSSENPTWLYETPGLFRWHVKEAGREWDSHAQQQALQILGEGIAGFINRALTNGWYDSYIACVRHRTCNGNKCNDHTHRRMLEIVESITGIEFEWIPNEDTITQLTEERSSMAWNMSGVAHSVVQSELSEALNEALETTT